MESFPYVYMGLYARGNPEGEGGGGCDSCMTQ